MKIQKEGMVVRAIIAILFLSVVAFFIFAPDGLSEPVATAFVIALIVIIVVGGAITWVINPKWFDKSHY